MFASTLALFTRSFRIDARSAQPNILRFLLAALILLELIWTQQIEVVFGAPGLTAFKWISWLNFVLITFAGLGYFATAISEEKEEDSLGLLKMAGISPVALLLGKSTTRLISVLLMLAVEFPFVLLSITLGGVTMSQVIAMAVALAAYLVFVANLGLICSVVGRNARGASTMMTLTLIALLVVMPVLGTAASTWIMVHPSQTLMRDILATFATAEGSVSMWNRISAIQSTGFAERAGSPQVIFHLVAALVLFGLSWAGFERFTRQRHNIGTLERIFAQPFRRLRRRSIGRAWPLAITWKDFNFVAGGTRMVFARFVLFFLIIGGFFWLITALEGSFSRQKWSEHLGDVAMMSMLIAAAVELSLIASRVFREEVKAQTLPLLMMLPKTTGEIAWSKIAAALPALAPSLCYFLLGALLDPENFSTAFHDIFTSWSGWYVLLWFVLFLHIAASLSLVVKWGALPLAILLIAFCQMFLFPLFAALAWYFRMSGMNNEAPMFLCLIVIALAGITFLEYQIPRRLKTLAGR